MDLPSQLDELLPQTQCQRCGYPACKPYAEALAAGLAKPNQCPPGKQEGADALAHLLNVAPLTLDGTRGKPGVTVRARIVEDLCIGCTKCIRACPVDAIIGGNKRMHTVITARCTGCELCLPPCPTDCIVLDPLPEDIWNPALAGEARQRHLARARRLGAQSHLAAANPLPLAATGATTDFVQRALEAARLRLAGRKQPGTPNEIADVAGTREGMHARR